jgi:hypothetical protein
LIRLPAEPAKPANKPAALFSEAQPTSRTLPFEHSLYITNITSATEFADLPKTLKDLEAVHPFRLLLPKYGVIERPHFSTLMQGARNEIAKLQVEAAEMKTKIKELNGKNMELEVEWRKMEAEREESEMMLEELEIMGEQPKERQTRRTQISRLAGRLALPTLPKSK